MSPARRLPALLTALVVAGLPLGCAGGRVGGVEAHALVRDGARLVDVRTAQEYASSHLDGALNLPVQELDRRLGELGRRDAPVVVYCHSGNRSARAARLLAAAGFSRVYDLGGIDRWDSR